MLVIATTDHRRTCLILVALILFVFPVWPKEVAGNDHKRSESHHKRYERVKEQYNYENRKGRQVKKEDKGNEITGQTAAWFLVAGHADVEFTFQGIFTALEYHHVMSPADLCNQWLHSLVVAVKKVKLPHIKDIAPGKTADSCV